MSRKIQLHLGTILGAMPCGQIRSYCGQLTPQFYTKEQGIRNLKIGTSDPEFHPWKKSWAKPLRKEILESDLPEDFAEFCGRLGERVSIDSDVVKFYPDQIGGFLGINRLIRHTKPVVTLAMGIPMLQKDCDRGSIGVVDALIGVQAMVQAWINEQIPQAYDIANRWPGYARFEWETYYIEEFINAY